MNREKRSWFAPVMLLGYAVIGLVAYLWAREARMETSAFHALRLLLWKP
jgi:hypothetical protein